MNHFLFYLFILCAATFMINYLFIGVNAKTNTEKWLAKCYEPKQPNKFKIWLCNQRKHAGQALHYIEGNQGTSKVKCLGCGAIFLEGRKIHVHLTKN